MQIGLKDIDPSVAETCVKRIKALWQKWMKRGGWVKVDLSEDEQRACETIEQHVIPAWLRRFRWLIIPLGSVGMFLFFNSWVQSPASWYIDHPSWMHDHRTGLLIVGLLLVALFVGGDVWLHRRINPAVQMQRSLLPEEVRAVAPLLPLTEGERLYCEALSLLLEQGDRLPETSARDLLGQLNTLLGDYRLLETQRQGIQQAIGYETAAELDVARAEMARQLEQTADPVAQWSLRQSLQIGETRLQNARSLEPTQQRLEAQQEVILQTFASVQSSLARLKVAPAPLAAPDLEEIQQAVVQINAQTQAVEETVQEVIALRVE